MLPCSSRSASSRPAAFVLAWLMVLLVVLPGLAGLMVCFGPNGPMWSGADCPNREIRAVATMAPSAEAERPCVEVPGVDPFIAETTTLPTPPDVPGLLATVEPTNQLPATADAAHAVRGPPEAARRALRSVVLRI